MLTFDAYQSLGHDPHYNYKEGNILRETVKSAGEMVYLILTRPNKLGFYTLECHIDTSNEVDQSGFSVPDDMFYRGSFMSFEVALGAGRDVCNAKLSELVGEHKC